MDMKDILTVTELTANIKLLLESNFDHVWVEGEISNLRRPASGHVYFTLKDEGSQIRAVIFKYGAGKMSFDLEDGMSIVCRGRLSVYQPRGEYQIIVDAAEPKGIGALQIAFEQLKGKLEKEGLFDSRFKKKIPFLPGKIGVITSPSGAAIRDILNITKRRFSSIDVLIAPVRVQGVEAPPEICEAISLLNRVSKVDVIIIARGGGSIEDLFPFNDERVARAIHASDVPIVSAVGHEIDFTISDFVADLRAPTPSAAAELVVPDKKALIENVGTLRSRLINSDKKFLAKLREIVTGIKLKDPRRNIDDLRIRLDESCSRLSGNMKRELEGRRNRILNIERLLTRTNPSVEIRNYLYRLDNTKRSLLEQYSFLLAGLKGRLQESAIKLDDLSPLSVLKRGFGIVRKLPEGFTVKDANSISAGDSVEVKLSSGGFKAKVTNILTER